MLPYKPWKMESILRLVARVFVCMFIGNALVAAMALPSGWNARSGGAALAALGVAVALLAVALWLLRKEWTSEVYLRNLTLLLVCFYAALLLAGYAERASAARPDSAGSPWRMLVFVMSFQGTTLLLVHGFLREHRTTWAEGFGLERVRIGAVTLGCVAGLLLTGLGWLVQGGLVQVLDRLHIPAEEQQAVEILRSTKTLWGRSVLGVAAVLIAPAGEEVLFRGIFYPALRQRGFRWLAWLGTSVLFGAIHVNAASFVPLTLLAMALIWLYERTGNLLTPVVAHTVFNAVNFAYGLKAG